MDRREDLYDPITEPSDEGFGPGTDLVFSVAALLLLILTLLRVSAVTIVGGDLDNQYLSRNKASFVHAMEISFGHKAVPNRGQPDTLKVSSENGDITIRDLITFQRISFGADVLFDTGKAELLPRGKEVLSRFRGALTASVDTLMEIQINGHTDIRGEDSLNLRLGAERAMAVYNELRQLFGPIDPSRVLISATSYGKYSPVNRNPRNSYSSQQLEVDNQGDAQLQANRRIEVAIIYRLAAPKRSISSKMLAEPPAPQ